MSHTLVLHGSTGDLSRRLVLPSLFDLYDRMLLPEGFHIVGTGRGMEADKFPDHVSRALDDFAFGKVVDESAREKVPGFLEAISFAGPGATDDPSSLKNALRDVEGNLIHYLALPPTLFEQYTEALHEADLLKGCRIVYEKPFGASKAQFESLNKLVSSVLEEKQVWRMDHFLGAEITQNLRLMRLFNPVLAATWNKDYIAEVQIDFPEQLDIDMRPEFYDATGAFLDVVMTHLFQMVAEIAMEPTADRDDALEARSKVFEAMRPLSHDDVVFGQFEGYAETKGIPSDSTTETLAAVRVWIDNDRWRGVPFILRHGKQMGETLDMMTIVYREPKVLQDNGTDEYATLTFKNFYTPGVISLSTPVKQPGAMFNPALGAMTQNLRDLEGYSGPDKCLQPYARQILDIIAGDESNFTAPQGLEAIWDKVDPILSNRPTPVSYPRGSMGPDSVLEMPATDRWWRRV